MITINLQKYDEFIHSDLSHLMIDHRKCESLKSNIIKEDLYDTDGNKLEWTEEFFLYIADYIHCKDFKVKIIAQDGFYISEKTNKSNNVTITRDIKGFLSEQETYIISINNNEIQIKTNNVVLMRYIRSRHNVFYDKRLVDRSLKREKENFNI